MLFSFFFFFFFFFVRFFAVFFYVVLTPSAPVLLTVEPCEDLVTLERPPSLIVAPFRPTPPPSFFFFFPYRHLPVSPPKTVDTEKESHLSLPSLFWTFLCDLPTLSCSLRVRSRPLPPRMSVPHLFEKEKQAPFLSLALPFPLLLSFFPFVDADRWDFQCPPEISFAT